jgi:hypothetical protein
VFLCEYLMEAQCAVKIEPAWVQGLMRSKMRGFTDSFCRKPIPLNSLLLTEMWAMPASSLRCAAVRSGKLTNQWSSPLQLKQFFFPELLASILPLSSFFPGTGWGGFLSDDAALHKCNATPTARLALSVGGFIPVCKLEDLVIGARDVVRYREGVIVDLLLEVPMCFIAEAV